MVYELASETAPSYLDERGILVGDGTPPSAVEAAPLGGGVSNIVIQVETDDDCLVLKQPRPNLAVEDDWPADIGRVHNEAAAARAYEAVIEAAGLDARVPGVRFEDEAAHVIGVECAPADATMWKRELLDGQVDRDIARAVGRVLGAVHDHAAGDSELRAKFENKTPFDQLRVDPYHRTTAERHPEVADEIRTEIDRVTDVERTLVHGDYSPKNVLVERVDDGDTAAVPWILDFEVAHWGDPAFDTGFMLNHLFIKSIHNHERQAAYLDAVDAFWKAYDERVDWDIEGDTVRELGVLMLARVDGKSPVEYIDDETGEVLRRVATRVLRREAETLDGMAAIAREEVSETWR